MFQPIRVPRPTTAIRSPATPERSLDLFVFIAFITPNVITLSVFSYWPMIRNLFLSFTYWDMIAPEPLWVGLENWIEVLTSTTFWSVLRNTLVFTVGSVGIAVVIALGLSLLLNQKRRGRNVVRAAMFAPAILPGSAIALVWTFLLAPYYGLISQAATGLGMPMTRWQNDPFWAMPTVILVVIWKSVGYDAVIFLAGLQGIPRELYEAARVDGANAWQRFVNVTIPGLSPVAFFLTVTSILASFQAFDVIRVMTNGGPVIATTTLIFQVYTEAFVGFNAGRAATYATILFALMLAITVVQIRMVEKRVTYE